jgi:hypothetical protein
LNCAENAFQMAGPVPHQAQGRLIDQAVISRSPVKYLPPASRSASVSVSATEIRACCLICNLTIRTGEANLDSTLARLIRY